MKNLIKITISVLLVFSFIFPTKSMAKESVTLNKLETTNEIEKNINTIKLDLAVQGNDVVSELNKQIQEFKEMLNEETNLEEREKLIGLIWTTEEMIREYQAYNSGIFIQGKDHPVYTPAVATVVAWFHAKGYKLAAELLTQAKKNNKINSIYYPKYGDRVKKSQVFKDIKKNNKTKGSATFPNKGNTNDKDLYYAIHNFNYVKYPKIIHISDIYDYDKGDYKSIAGVAIETMRRAQAAGVIVPYRVYIVIDRWRDWNKDLLLLLNYIKYACEFF